MQGQDRIIGIVLAGQERTEAHLLQLRLEAVQHFTNLGCLVRIFGLVSHLDHDLQIIVLILQALQLGYDIPCVFQFLCDLGRLFGILPKLLGFQFSF